MSLTGLAFLLVFFALLLMAFARHPIYGLVAYVSEFYLHPPSRWWGESLPDLRWSMLAAVVTIIAAWTRLPAQPGRQPWYATSGAKIMLAFVAWFYISGTWAMSPDVHWAAAVQLTKYMAVYYMMYRIADTPERIRVVLLTHIVGCLYLGLLAWTSDSSGRLDGVGGPGIDDSNTLGMQLDTAVVAAAMLVLHLRGWKQWLCFVAIAFALNGVILTESRGAFLALVAGGAMLFYLKPIVYRRMFFGYAVFGVLALGYVASEQFWSRMDTLSATIDKDQELESSAESRIALLKAQLQMSVEHPFGAGQRGTEAMSARYLDPKWLTAGGARSSHNAFLTTLVEQGVPGAILFVGLVVWTALALRRLRNYFADKKKVAEQVLLGCVGGTLMVVLVGGLFADFSRCEVQIWMFGLLASLQHLAAEPTPARDTAMSRAPGAARPPSVARRAR